MKEYFSHDYNARNDTRLVKLQMKHGLAGLGAYWCIIEMLYEEGGYLPVDEYARITFELRTNYETITSIINDFDLFVNDGDKFWSESALNRLNKRAEISETARQNISKRWEKYGGNTGVIPAYNGGNTIKVNKSKLKEEYIEEKSWRNDYDIYLSDLRTVFKELIADKEFIAEQEKYNPGVNIRLTIEKACKNFWATEAGWKRKKSARTKTIDWRQTLTNAISLSSNKVYNQKVNEQRPEPTYNPI